MLECDAHKDVETKIAKIRTKIRKKKSLKVMECEAYNYCKWSFCDDNKWKGA